MKKILISVLLASLTFAAFADDAKVLPSGVMRLTLANLILTADQAYDDDGEAQDSTEYFFDNFGAAVEFGITDKISAAVQWVPGVMLADDYTNDALAALNDQLIFTGISDFFVGAKIQVLKTDDMRFAFAPGVIIPADSLDGLEEGRNALAGDDFRLASQSETESLGFGGRFYFDYQINKDFYVNLYNQTKYYLPNERYDDGAGATYAGTVSYYVNTLGQPLNVAVAAAEAATVKHEYEYPIYLDFELEPHYDLTLSKTGSMGFGLPVKYSMKGETTVEGVGQDDDSYSFSINPGLSFFYTGGIPFEVAANYDIPLMGKNADKRSMFTFKLKLFYDFY